MKGLEALRRRLECLKAAIPKLEPWPPEEGSFSWCLYEKLGKPAEKMEYFDMYFAVAEAVWAGVSTVDMVNFAEATEC
jgi:hypothetical protein